MAQEAVTDAAIIEKLPSMSTARLKELLGTYGRLENKGMLKPVAKEIIKRDPKDELAKAVIEGRPLDFGIDADMARSSAEDINYKRIEQLRLSGRHSELIAFLNDLKAKAKPGSPFLYPEELAFAYYESGNRAAARREFVKIRDDAGAKSSSKEEARKMLVEMDRMEDIETGDALIKGGMGEAALEHADRTSRKYGGHPDVVALRVRALIAVNRSKEALAELKKLKANSGSGFFPYGVEEASALLELKHFDEAEAILQNVVSAGAADAIIKREARAALRDLAKLRKLEEGYMHATAMDYKKARGVLEELNASHPNDPDVKIFEAEILLNENDKDGALALLDEVEAKYYANGNFPGQSVRAAAFHAMNELGQASVAYDEILENPYIEAETKLNAERSVREIERETSALFHTSGEYSTEDEGDIYRIGSFYRSPYSNDWRLWIWGDVDIIRAVSETLLLDTDEERFSAGLSVERRLSAAFSGAVSIGGSEDHVVGGGSASYLGSRGGNLNVEVIVNDRARDSVSLEALDGREHRVELSFEKSVTPRITAEGYLYGRQVRVDGNELGNGGGGEFNLDYLIVDNRKRRPAVRVGYAGEVHLFDAGSLPDATVVSAIGLENARENGADFVYYLVEEEINLHGPRFVVEGILSDVWSYLFQGAFQYDFFDEEIQWRLGTGLEYFIRENASLIAGVEYYSAGQTGSSASGVVLGNLGVSIVF